MPFLMTAQLGLIDIEAALLLRVRLGRAA